MKRILHKIAHIFGWNHGEIETWWGNNKKLYVGFRCNCGELQGIEEAHSMTMGTDGKTH